MATLVTQEITRTGIIPIYAAAAAGGDSFLPGDSIFLHVKNGGGGSITLTVLSAGEVIAGMTKGNIVKTVTNDAAGHLLGPFPLEHFAATSLGALASITYSGVTSVTIAVLELSRQ